MFSFFHELLDNEIIPNFDCNKIPSCLIDETELQQFRIYLKNKFIKEHIAQSNISNRCVTCSPVIDIRQDLTAVRCFGLSEYTKVNIENFKGIRDLINYYTNAYYNMHILSMNKTDFINKLGRYIENEMY